MSMEDSSSILSVFRVTSFLLIVVGCVAVQAEDPFKFRASKWTLPNVPINFPGMKFENVDNTFIIKCSTNRADAIVTLQVSESLPQGKPFVDVLTKSSNFRRYGQLFYITKVSLRDAGTYRCVATDSNNKRIELLLGRLHIRNVRSDLNPEIYPNLPRISVESNSRYTVKCRTVGVSGGSILTWYRKDSSGKLVKVDKSMVTYQERNSGGQVIDTQSLLFAKFTDADVGDYICERQLHGEKPTRKSVQIIRKRDELPTVSIEASTLTPSEYLPLTLRCNVTGSPIPQRAWSKDGKPVNERCADVRSPCVHETRSVRYDDHNGVFTCTATNLAGSASKSVTIRVQVAPVVRQTYRDTVLARNNEEYYLFVDVLRGQPSPTVTWYQQKCQTNWDCKINDALWTRVDNQVPKSSVPTRHSHMVTPATESDYWYRYEVKNMNGLSRFIFKVIRKANHPHQFSIIPESEVQEVQEGAEISLKCKIDSEVYSRALFRKDGVSISYSHQVEGRTRVILFRKDRAQASDAGVYECVGSTWSDGRRSRTVRLLVRTTAARGVCATHRARQLQQQGNVVGAFVPKCNPDGTYLLKQCHGSTGYCWCVDQQNGKMITGTTKGPSEGEVKCGVHPCETPAKGGCTQSCYKNGDSFYCYCNAGYTLAADKRTCNKDVAVRPLAHTCDTRAKGGCTHNCVKKENSYYCNCRDGFQLAVDAKTCSKVEAPVVDCVERNIEYDGTSITYIRNVKQWSDCAAHCARSARCQFWTLYDITSSWVAARNICFLRIDLTRKLSASGVTSGSKTCSPDKVPHYCDTAAKGGCTHKCIKAGNGYHCSCNSGYKLADDRKTCEKELVAPPTLTTPSPTHPCDTRGRGGCHHNCIKNGREHYCLCNSGFKLAGNRRACIEAHPCDTGNGGCAQLCKRNGGDGSCACHLGFILAADKKTCVKSSQHPCDTPGNGECSQICFRNGIDSYCSCKPGFELARDGKTCDKMASHECDLANGGCSHNCNRNGSESYCSCNDGDELASDGKTCNKAYNNYICNAKVGEGQGKSEFKVGNQVGDACIAACMHAKRTTEPLVNGVSWSAGRNSECWCEREMTAINPKYKTFMSCLLEVIDPCTTNLTTHQHQCHANATCTPHNTWYNCTCKGNYQGDGLTCKPYDPCTTNITSLQHKCHDNATCTPTESSFNCSCRKGFGGDGEKCAPVNPCTTNLTSYKHQCHANATCTPTESSYNCTCMDQFLGNGTNCTYDEHVCDLPGKAGCSQKCNKNGTGYYCSCKAAHKLADNNKNCTAIPNYICNAKIGDGNGIEEKVETKDDSTSGEACMAACWKRRETDPTINGITWLANKALKGCWCEKGMVSVNPKYTTFRSCLIKAVDPCTTNITSHKHQCAAEAKCTLTKDAYNCTCQNNTVGDGLTCKPYNPCTTDIASLQHKCHDNATCTPTESSYNCSCTRDFLGDGNICLPINPCTTNLTSHKHQCHKKALCTPTKGSYECACVENYNGDGKNCSYNAPCDHLQDLEVHYSFNGTAENLADLTAPNATISANAKLLSDFVTLNVPGHVSQPAIDLRSGPWVIDFTVRLLDVNATQSLVADRQTNRQLKNVAIRSKVLSGGKVFVYLGLHATNTSEEHNVEVTSDGSLEAGKWTRVQFVWVPAARNLSVYFDGELAGSGVAGASVTNVTLVASNGSVELGRLLENGTLNADIKHFYFYRSDKQCPTYINPCTTKYASHEHKCHAEATCTPNGDSYNCTCNKDYAGDGKASCVRINPCTTNLTSHKHKCHENASCTVTPTSYDCTCQGMFIGNGTECTAASWEVVSNVTILVNASAQLANVAEKKSFDALATVQKYADNKMYKNFIYCPRGNQSLGANEVSRNNTAFIASSAVPALTNSINCDLHYLAVNPCTTNVTGQQHSCHDNATCSFYNNNYTCECNDNFVGNGTECKAYDPCATNITSLQHKCHANATCTPTESSYNCSCVEDYFGDGKQCSRINPCTTNLTSHKHNCHEEARCSLTPTSFECTCQGMFIGNGTNCTIATWEKLSNSSLLSQVVADINTQESEDKAMMFATNKSYKAFAYCGKGKKIDAAFFNTQIDTEKNLEKNEACDLYYLAVNPCTTNVTGQQHSCHDNATCSFYNNNYTCECNGNFVGNGSECKAYNPCTTNNTLLEHKCHANATCTPTESSYNCSCSEDFTGDGEQCTFKYANGTWGAWAAFTKCNATCGGGQQTRVRNCSNPLNPSGAYHPLTTCVSSGNATERVSGEEMQSRMCNLQVCPIHPCDTPIKGGCAHTCHKNQKDLQEYYCSCYAGYRLASDPKSCIEDRVPVIVPVVSNATKIRVALLEKKVKQLEQTIKDLRVAMKGHAVLIPSKGSDGQTAKQYYSDYQASFIGMGMGMNAAGRDASDSIQAMYIYNTIEKCISRCRDLRSKDGTVNGVHYRPVDGRCWCERQYETHSNADNLMHYKLH